MTEETNNEVFNRMESEKEKTNNQGGRPSVNRELAYDLLNRFKPDGSPQYSNKTLRRQLNCSSKTLSRLRSEMIEKGIVSKKEADERKLSMEERDFDTECIETMGYSLREFILSRTKKQNATRIFSFIQKVWTNVWNKPFLSDVRDPMNPLADNLAIQFLNTFGSDNKRIRYRIKHINYFFRFMGRMDVHDRHLKLNISKHPLAIKDIPELSFVDSPLRVQKAIEIVGSRYGKEAELIVKLKIVSLMRTGSAEDKRELWGVQCGSVDHSYLIMNSADEYQFRVHAKANEDWTISWIPKEVREQLWEIYQTRKNGEKLIKMDMADMRKAWKDATIEAKVNESGLSLHDARKISATWLYIMGIRLEDVAMLNVGWKDLNTLKTHYLQIKTAIPKDKREQYRRNIPEWFKEGLDQYIE